MISPALLRRLLRAATPALLAVTVLAPSARAQSFAHGRLAGVVRNAQGLPIRDAEVVVRDRASGAARRLTTRIDGEFSFALLVASTYDVRIEALGFRPIVYVNVSVGPGVVPLLRPTLRAEAAAVLAVDTVRVTTTRAAPLAWLAERGYADLAGGRRLATDHAMLSPTADESSVDGLAWKYADVMVDGLRVGGLTLPGEPGSAAAALALPLRAVANASVGALGNDVEISGTGVGLNALSLRAGVPSLRVQSFGGTSDLGGAVVMAGDLQRDTASAIVGFDYQRSMLASPALFAADDPDGLALVDLARSAYGVDLSALTRETERLEERSGGFGRLDWQVGDRYAVSLHGAASRLVLESRREALAAQAALHVVARITDAVSAEVRMGGEFGEVTADATAIPATSFAGRGLAIGSDADVSFADERSTPRLAAIMHWHLGAHRVKFGGVLAAHRFSTRTGGESRFRFGDATDFGAAVGAWRGLEAPVRSGSFAMRETAFFLQDSWSVTDRLSVLLGLRFDGAVLPLDELATNTDWLAATGLDSRAVAAPSTRVAPRLGFQWELGANRRWVLDGGAAIFHDAADRRDVGDALALDLGVGVRSALGSLGGWPGLPGANIAADRGTTIALLAPEFQGPRTRRLSLGLSRHAGPFTAYVNGSYRQTDYLARRRDLNLAAAPRGIDQDGRPLLGSIEQVGSLLAATPGTERRFDGFDEVLAIESTGFSEFAAVTAGLERVVERGLSFGVHYTFSRTRDNLVPGAGSLGALGSAGEEEWAEGRADTDAPHRLIAAAEWNPLASGRARLGAIFRMRSGTPFTPGFRAGVDANGDGVAGNDPAYVDGALGGMDALLADHACLREATGTFVARNACRGELVHRVDLRAAFELFDLRGGPVALVLDAIDVLGTDSGPLDRALFLVDRTGSVQTNAATGVTTLPLVVNPNFGELLADRAAGMLFRVGLRIGR